MHIQQELAGGRHNTVLFNNKANTKTHARQPQQQIETSTIRTFDGGLNVADTDLNMSPKYAHVLDNLERAIDGSLAVRPGTVFFADVNQWGNSNDIINCTYFNDYVICVQANGAITKTDASGTTTQMLLGGVNPWTTTITSANFSINNSDLIIVNGVDKPLIISGIPSNPNYMTLQYLVDLATLSNINTPIGKYCASHGQYFIIAGDSANRSTIYVASKGTSGTFPGDPAPNDSIAIDLGPRVSIGSSTITGLLSYRDKLLVSFERGILPLTLGNYTGSPAVHDPTDDGFVEEYGCLSQRSMISVADNSFFLDNVGINGIQRVAPFNVLRPQRVSQYINTELTSKIQNLTTSQIEQYVHAVYDLRNNRYMVFVPVITGSTVTETLCYSFTTVPDLQIKAWARLKGWVFRSSCRTTLQNIIFSRGTKLYYYDLAETSLRKDRYNDPAVNSGDGEDIEFVWELPWADFQRRMHVKQSKFLALDVQGTAYFTTEMFVDNFRDTPLLSMRFTGGDAGGFGNNPFGNSPFGGGRDSSEERLYVWEAPFKIMKLRFSGNAAAGSLKFISISIAYLRKSVRR